MCVLMRLVSARNAPGCLCIVTYRRLAIYSALTPSKLAKTVCNVSPVGLHQAKMEHAHTHTHTKYRSPQESDSRNML